MFKSKVAALVTFFTILFITGFPTESSAYFPDDYVQKSYVDSEEIPVKSVYDIVQTEDGYIWIASFEGLVRYDGTSSYVFTESDGFPSMVVNDLFIDSYGNLWIGTNDAGLVLYQNDEFTTIDTENGLPHNMVRDIEEGQNGNIVVATQGGISVISQGLEVDNHSTESLSADYPIDLVVADSGYIFIITNDGNILKANESDISGTLEIAYNPKETGGPRATAVFQSTDDSIFFGFSDGKIIKSTDGVTTKYDGTSLKTITSFYEADGVIYVCGADGLGVIYGNDVVKIEGLELDGIIDAVLKDYEGNYWIGSSRDGMVKLVKNTYSNVSASLGLPELTVNSTAVFNGDLYIGSDDGLTIIDDKTQQIVNNDISKLLKDIRIRNLCVIEDQLWISTYSSNLGLVILDSDGSYESINTSNSDLPSDDVRFTIPLQNNQAFVGTKNGAAIIEEAEIVSVYDMSNGLENEFILSACQTSDGTIYVGTDGGGLYTIAPTGEVAKVENDTNLNNDIVLRVETDPKTDNVWMSVNGGLAYVDAKGVHPVPEVIDLNLTPYDIKFYEDDIWLLCSDGIYIFDRIAFQNGEPIELNKLGEAHFNITPNSWSTVYEDTILISTTNGVYSVNMSKYYENESVPLLSPPIIMADDNVVPIVNGVAKIPSDTERISIEASMLSNTYDGGYQMTIQLEGVDDEPIVFEGKNAETSYTNLPGGTYELVITGENYYGSTAEPIHILIQKAYALSELAIVKVLKVTLFAVVVIFVTNFIQKKRNKAKTAREQEHKLVTDQAINAIADAIDAKDPYTRGHSNRVAEYSVILGKSFGLDAHELDNLYIAGLLHDIGKIGVDERILRKSGKLTCEEFEEIRKHSKTGADILKGITVVENVAIGAKYHHERFDGKGYPEGLKGKEIPLYARLICVADSYDAMTSTRPYRLALTPEQARDELIRYKGTQFDPEIVDLMVKHINKGLSKTTK